MAKQFTDENFETEVLNSKLPVLVDFYADWCGPCKKMAPVIDALAAEYEGVVTIGKLNIDNSPDTSGRYRVMSIPTMILFQNGQPVSNVVGAVSKEALKAKLEEIK